MLAVSVALVFALWVRRSSQQSNTDPAGLLPSYDYIICGGGTAGLTVAARLAEDQNVTVLVVEAGSTGSNDNWNYPAVPAEFGAGVTQDLPAGKALGGSSAINGGVYTRAEAVQIDTWEKVGNPGWNWESLFQYYLKSETIAEPNEAQKAAGMTFNPAFHGTGPVNTGWPANVAAQGYLGLLQQAYPLLGIPVIEDGNGGDMHGLSTFPRTHRNVNGVDVKESSRTAYYDETVAERPNLVVLTEATARRIVWADSPVSGTGSNVTIRATGVLIGGSSERTIEAKREVILAGGAYRSPTILEFSGVGNPSILTPLGVEVKVNLPGVGEHLMDQTNNDLAFFNAPNNTFTSGNTAYVAFITAEDVWGVEGAAAIAKETLDALPSYAEKIAARNNGATSASDILTLLQVQYDAMFVDNITVVEFLHGLQLNANDLICEFWSSQPFTRGNVHITTGEPPSGTNSPGLRINNNFFMLDYDLKSQIGAARAVRRLYGTAPLNGSIVADETRPGLNTVPLDASDDEWEVWLKTKFRSAWHPAGTTSMLPRAMGGVVDPNLKVYGTANVRVVDASVFPYQINGHTSATVYAVAEKAADLIKASYA